MRRACRLAVGATLAALPALLPAQTVPPGFQVSTAFSGRANPTAIRFARDGRVYIAQKSGQIFEYDNIADTSGTQVADLRTNVHNFWDRGLLGFALDPEFPEEPYFYVLYTHDAGIGGIAPRWGSAGATNDGCGGTLSNGGPTASNGGCVVSGRLSRLTLAGGSTAERVPVEGATVPWMLRTGDACESSPSGSPPARDAHGSAASGAEFGTSESGTSTSNGAPQ